MIADLLSLCTSAYTGYNFYACICFSRVFGGHMDRTIVARQLPLNRVNITLNGTLSVEATKDYK